ncbi:hypothetical protein GCK32_019094 [Trichostrongylus colubriformis]|uniref:Secreted protein n=1 Tax=Trichostrongylus colubriformis TaxID=6319 RepID=A0AAN8F3D4_TRICO
MLLTSLLTLLLVSTQCVSDIQNSTFVLNREDRTSQASVPDRCFPLEVLIRVPNNGTSQPDRPVKASADAPAKNKSQCVEESPLNATKARAGRSVNGHLIY